LKSGKGRKEEKRRVRGVGELEGKGKGGDGKGRDWTGKENERRGRDGRDVPAVHIHFYAKSISRSYMIQPIPKVVTVAWSVCLSVCLSVQT